MAANDFCFVEWKEQFVSKEKGNRVVHYFLKDSSGESILAVVGTERSVRHMFYVVSEEFLRAHGAENSVHAGFRWRSRREVVNWLTSMLSKQHRQRDSSKSPNYDPVSSVSIQQPKMADHKAHLARNLKGHPLDIVWSGVAWTCGKQLKHYPSYCRNGITITVQSFVFVMAEKDNRYLAYLEDMYEDRKTQKKVKVRWFHYNREVKGVVSLRNPHPREVFITPYAQVISAECVDGPAIVLTREHYEKCEAVFPDDLLGRIHFCFRQFKNNRVKPFELSKLRGYFDQPIFMCFSPDFFEDEEFSPQDDVKAGGKRTRSCMEHGMRAYDCSYQKLKDGLLIRNLNSDKHVEGKPWHITTFKVHDKIEVLCQDSGIRGCWFRCTVLEVSRRQMKIQYDDVKDEDSCGNLEEWIPLFRVARPDKLGMRITGRPTVRPATSSDQTTIALEVGTPVDAWWSDGWWEGVITSAGNPGNDSHQVYIPSENLFLNILRKDLRISRDWVGNHWVDIEANPDILSVLSTSNGDDAKLSISSVTSKDANSDNSPTSCGKDPTSRKLGVVEEETHELETTKLTDGNPSEYNDNHVNDNDGKSIADNLNDDMVMEDSQNNEVENNDAMDEGSNEERLLVLGANEQKCEEETMEVTA